MALNPYRRSYLFRLSMPKETTAGGIVLPDAAREKPQRGKVVAVGPGRLLESGERAAVAVAEGDGVLFLRVAERTSKSMAASQDSA